MFPSSQSQEEFVSMFSKVYIALDEYEKFSAIDFVAKYLVTSEGLWRDRVVEMMDYFQLKFVN